MNIKLGTIKTNQEALQLRIDTAIELVIESCKTKAAKGYQQEWVTIERDIYHTVIAKLREFAIFPYDGSKAEFGISHVEVKLFWK